MLSVTLSGLNPWSKGPQQPPVVTESTNDFLTFRLSGRTPDVVASDFRRLARWLAPRVDFALPNDLAVPAGFRLTGGRLCSFLGRRLVSYSFVGGEAAAALYIMSGDDPAALQGPWQGHGVEAFVAKGLSALVWRDGGLLYALVSDLPQADLRDFYQALHATAGAEEAQSETLTTIRASRLRPPRPTAARGLS